MRKKYKKHIATLIAISLLTVNLMKAQSSNALDFDGTSDFVTSQQGAALIAGSSNISMTMWVYPRNPAPSFPDFDGFAGIRNNTDADFYILELTPTSVEARFRNSAGTPYDIVGTGLQINTWQHLALTYDGSMLRYYLNGAAHDSLAATGNILNTTEMFYIGGMMYQTTNYFLNGKMDEVSLWSRTLSPSEISCIYNNGADTTDAALKLYYRFNQGVAGGNNTGLNTLIDETGTSNGALNTFTLIGSTSNWVAGVNNIIVYTDTICNGQTYNFNGQSLSASGTYYAHFPLTSGCDSAVMLNLIVRPPVDTLVLQNVGTLAAHANGVSYQWINCGTGSPIVGATNQLYSPASTGNYAVIITQNNCSDTSGCHYVLVSGLGEQHMQPFFSVFPNPFKNVFEIRFINEEKNITLLLTDINGREILRTNYLNQQNVFIKTYNLASGMYFVKIISDQKVITLPVIKE
jgi:hypothetical protein